MGRESSLLFALLAFRQGHLTRGQLLESTALWMQDPSRDLAQLLVEAGRLKPETRAELSRIVADWERARGAGKSAPGPLPPSVRETIVALRNEGVVVSDAPAPAPAPDRYDAGPELGRGGIGRVIEATDRVLGRPVALKLLYGGTPQELSDRFRWEARITGRLEHPNIVPVHDVGMLPSTGEQFMAMKRIVGKDMGRVIKEGGLPLRRLVEALRDACRAVSYAHSRGVIHRDLKPANIMLGDFGEVLVVDWGLARLVGEEDRASQLRKSAARVPGVPARPIASREETSRITVDGDVLGTPAYMPPEQAMGWLQKIDERSDVYSLGASLYEVLAGRPPYMQENSKELLEAVLAARMDPPSRHRECPMELEAICLKAMAYQAGDRYPNVAEMAAALDAWLEGALERERRERMAEEEFRRAEAATARWRRAADEIRRLNDSRQAEDDAGTPMTKERSMAIFDIDDAITAARREGALAVAEANAALDTALSLVPRHAASRRLKAEIHWEQFSQAERAGNQAAMEVTRRMAEVFNDGSLDARLRGDGTMELRTRRWGCACLVEGRRVEPAELRESHWLLWSGARADGQATDHEPGLAPAGPLKLRVHGPSCRREPLDGAEAWAFRYEERDRVLVPVTPDGPSAGPPIPAALLDEVFGASPYRPQGPGLYLGRTPVARRPWPMGSWLLVLSAPGRLPQRYPFEVTRLQDVTLEATLYRQDEVPPGHLVVLGASFDSIRDAGADPFVDPVTVQDFFMARFPVTSAEWAGWLNGLGAGREGEALSRRPRMAPASGHLWPVVDGKIAIPTGEVVARLRAEGGAKELEGLKSEIGGTDWRPEWPVLGVSWSDAMTWARDRSLRDGWAFTPPTMFQFERAGRGGDRRRYPWGPRVWGELANTNRSFPAGQTPAPVDSFPRDESPWGIRGMGGNVGTHCLNDAGASYRTWRALRGGSWNRPETVGRMSFHQGSSLGNVRKDYGLRSAVLSVAGA